MKVVTLIENSKGERGLSNEWGLSLHIEAYGQRMLFDTGSSTSFARNAQTLGVDLGGVDLAVLSHGHYDHGGGMAAFFSVNEGAPLYLRVTADGDYFSKSFLGRRYIGLDRKVLETNRKRLRWVEGNIEVAPGVHILTAIPGSEPRPHTDRSLMVRTENGLVPDTFTHELVLVVKEQDGLSVITGCGHSGVLNMVLAAKDAFPGVPVKAVIGGFHMIDPPFWKGTATTMAGTKAVAARLKELGCRRVISGHCNGRKSSAVLRAELRGDYVQLRTGLTFEV